MAQSGIFSGGGGGMGEAAGGKGVGGESPQSWAILLFFSKNNAFLCIFRPK